MDTPLNDVDSPLRWADRITVSEHQGRLIVMGERLMGSRVDLMKEYERAEFSPHIQFANCGDDRDLCAFVENFGPVFADCGISETFLADENNVAARSGLGTPYESRNAIQLLGELRDEQVLFRAAMQIALLISQQDREASQKSQLSKKFSSTTRNHLDEDNAERFDRLRRLIQEAETIKRLTKGWEGQYQRTRKAISDSGNVDPEWRWSKAHHRDIQRLADEGAYSASTEMDGTEDIFKPDAFQYAKWILTVLLNAFPTSLTWHGKFFRDSPPDDLLLGIRPVLFAMLRRDLRLGRAIRMCDRQGCGNLYIPNRSDKLCCSLPCSIKHNARRYHLGVRKPQRKKAGKTKKSKKQAN
jgi:hypothetical protein